MTDDDEKYINIDPPLQGRTNIGSRTQSPDHSVTAHPGANVNLTRLTLPKDPWQLIVAILLALSMLGNVMMWVSYRQLQQTVDLDRYDDNTFINGRFADLKVEVETHEKLIQAYGLQKSLKEK
jgi:hypothetical protein